LSDTSNKHGRRSRELIYFATSPYEDPEAEQLIPADVDAAREAGWKILHEWHDLIKADGSEAAIPHPMANVLGALILLESDNRTRLSTPLLKEVVFHDPPRLEQVCRYVIHRSKAFQQESNWSTLATLVAMGRQSPWAKLWLLHAIDLIPTRRGRAKNAVMEWAMHQLHDRHETVRAQAAWITAGHNLLTEETLARLYSEASQLSQPALSAAAVRQGGLPKSVTRAIEEDHPLNKEASQWARGA
jgi:RNA-directed DNA polymerase